MRKIGEKEKFKGWLVRQGYASNTSNSYASAINKISRHLSWRRSKLVDVFAIDDLSVLKDLAEQYSLTGRHSSFGHEGNGSVRNAIKAYYRYKMYYRTTSTPSGHTTGKGQFSDQVSINEKEGAVFIGSKEEFKRYVGPLLRILMHQMTNDYKSEIGKCQDCGNTKNLEAIPLFGSDRNAIIDSILDTYSRNGKIHVPLHDFEKEFRKEHHALKETLQVLCEDCLSSIEVFKEASVNVSRSKETQKVPAGPNFFGRFYTSIRKGLSL